MTVLTVLFEIQKYEKTGYVHYDSAIRTSPITSQEFDTLMPELNRVIDEMRDEVQRTYGFPLKVKPLSHSIFKL